VEPALTGMRLVRVLACLGALLLSWHPAWAGATESARGRTTVRVEQNTITVDHKVTYVDYAVGEWLGVTVGYAATCSVVFKGLALRRPAPFIPTGPVSGEIDNVSGTPVAGQAAKTGSATFDIRFNTLNKATSGAQSGVARVNLVLGVDKDCDLATGDADGVDRSTTIRVEIEVTTEAKSGDE
jgi:hypothetical protein